LPHFEITNKILRNIGTIEACREIIESAPLIPAYERKFKEDIVVRTVYHATHLEGNELPFEETKKLIEGRHATGGEREVQEIINYRNVLKYLDEIEQQAGKEPNFVFKEGQLLKIHTLVVERIIPKEDATYYRKAQVVLKNSLTGEVVFRPPPAIEVPYYVSELINWLNGLKNEEFHPVFAAGISLYLLYTIHPFIEGNGRTARGFANLVLFAKKYDVRKLFSLEEFFDRRSEEYYEVLAKVDKTHPQIFQRDLTAWLEFFTLSLASELTRVKGEIKKISVDEKLKDVLGGKQVALSDRQVRLIEYIEDYGQIRMNEAKEIVPMVSDDTLLRDLMDLIKKGILRKKGSTKKAVYLLRVKREVGR